jgi:predicted nuclease of predicted toxin-antitoxin system
MDVHVPIAVTDGLRRRGIDVLTSQEDGSTEHDHLLLLKRASQLRRVLFPQDNDFIEIESLLQESNKKFIGLVYVHQLSLGIGEMIKELRSISDCADYEKIANRVIYLPLR